MNIDHFINVLFEATSVNRMGYIIKILFSDTVDSIGQYKYTLISSMCYFGRDPLK